MTYMTGDGVPPPIYSATPYSERAYWGIRNPGYTDRMVLLNINGSFTSPMADDIRAISGDAKLHLAYNAIEVDYHEVNESGEPDKIKEFAAVYERKVRFFPSTDAGLQFGYGSIGIGGSRFDGGVVGWTSDMFLFPPVSVKFQVRGLFANDNVITTTKVLGGIHMSRGVLRAGFRRLNIEGVVFDTWTIGYGIYL